MPGILPNRAGRARLFAFGALALAAVLVGCSGSSATPVRTTGGPALTATATTSNGATATPTGLATPTAKPTPTPSPTIGPCSAVDVAIEITVDQGIFWQGAAGHRAAKFKLTNGGSADCIVKAKSQPLLINGDGAVLITGAAAGSSASLTVAAGSSISAEVQTDNLCHAPTIVAPVRVAFVLPGIGTVIATTASPTDTGAIPPCLGDPAVASGDITMTVWAP
jgi:hypothetical protein